MKVSPLSQSYPASLCTKAAPKKPKDQAISGFVQCKQGHPHKFHKLSCDSRKRKKRSRKDPLLQVETHMHTTSKSITTAIASSFWWDDSSGLLDADFEGSDIE
eukprot:13955678-Ditylum_brightwellii.AAC.1